MRIARLSPFVLLLLFVLGFPGVGLPLVGGMTGTLLLLFSLRRILYGLIALFPGKGQGEALRCASLPESVLVLVPCHNEARVLPRLLEALQRERRRGSPLEVVVIDDASTDDTAGVVERFRRAHGAQQWLHLLERRGRRGIRGKAAALNDALATFPRGEIVVLFDADHAPLPGCIERILRPLSDSSCVAAGGVLRPFDPFVNPLTFYQYIEGLVHQAATLNANARLGLNPVLLGSNCAIRRDVLEWLGGFCEEALLEDIDLTLRITAGGGTIAFVPEGVSLHEVPSSASAYLEQHTSWSRGFYQMLATHGRSLLRNRALGFLRRVEALFFLAAYGDRVLLLLAAFLWVLDAAGVAGAFPLPGWLWGFFLGAPLIEILSVLRRDRAPLRALLWLPTMFLVFPLELWMVLRAVGEEILGRRRRGYKTPREGEEEGREAFKEGDRSRRGVSPSPLRSRRRPSGEC